MANELETYKAALELACDHIAKEHNLLFSLFGATLNDSIKDYFVLNARLILEARRLTEND